jgi:hypothetical protein
VWYIIISKHCWKRERKLIFSPAVTKVTGEEKTSPCVALSVSSGSSSMGQPLKYSSYLSYLECGLTGIMQMNDWVG